MAVVGRAAGVRHQVPAGRALSIDAVSYVSLSAAALLIGVALRALIVLPGRFPVGDGGLFYRMMFDLMANNFRLPRFTTYNGGQIPFAYPPLGLYGAAAAQRVSGLPLFDVMRFWPLAFACASIAAFALLARALLPAGAAVAAVFVFALVPDAFDMEVKGGGVTRAPGEFFALLAAWQIHAVLARRQTRNLPLAALFFGLTVLSHPEWAQFVAVTAVLFVVVYAPSRSGVFTGLGLFAGAAVVSAPWWLPVCLLHSPRILLAPLGGNAQVFPLAYSLRAAFTLQLTHEAWLPAASVLALCGMAVSLRERHWMLPIWLGLTLLTDSRGWQIPLALPVSLLAGVGLVAALQHLTSRRAGPTAGSPPKWVLLALAFLLVRSLAAGLAYEQQNNPRVSDGELTAMRWARMHTPAGTRFLVIGSSHGTSQEDVEWFPALSQRTSVETLQGTEWLPGIYAARSRQIQRIQNCLPDWRCVTRTLQANHIGIQAVYLARSSAGAPCDGLCAELAPRHRLLYAGSGAWIFRV